MDDTVIMALKKWRCLFEHDLKDALRDFMFLFLLSEPTAVYLQRLFRSLLKLMSCRLNKLLSVRALTFLFLGCWGGEEFLGLFKVTFMEALK